MLLLALGVGLSALTSCGSSSATPMGSPDVTSVHADYYVSEYGVRVGIQIGYDDARTVTAARLVLGGNAEDTALYPLDGSDPDVPPETIKLDRGDQVLLEHSLLVACTRDPQIPIYEVDSEANGVERTDHFRPANGAAYRQAVAEWCARPLTMNPVGSSVTPDGVYEIYVLFSNPDPHPVTFDRVDDGPATWDGATVVVPGGSIKEMTLRGHGPSDCPVAPPWETGHVHANGKVIRPTAAGSAATSDSCSAG
jgi:hypothetical protein